MVWVIIEPVTGGKQQTLSERSFLKWQKVKGSEDPDLRTDGRVQWRVFKRVEDIKGFVPLEVGPKLPDLIKPKLPEELAAVEAAPRPALPEELDPAGNPVAETPAEPEKKKPGRPAKAKP